MHKNLKKTNKNIDYVLNKSQKCFSMLKSLNNILNNPSINIQININDSLNKIEKLINYMKKLKNNLKKLKNLIIDSKKQGKNIDLLFSDTNIIHKKKNRKYKFRFFISDINYYLLSGYQPLVAESSVDDSASCGPSTVVSVGSS
jgi:hypothetical protein